MIQDFSITKKKTQSGHKPLIGMPTWGDRSTMYGGVDLFGLNQSYIDAVFAAGGTLYHDLATDLPEKEKHDFPGVGELRRQIRHNIFIEADSFLGQTLGEIVGVNSMHHQSVNTVGENFRVTAISEDGLPEGIEHTESRFAVGCQWHPEEFMNDPHHARLLTGFIEACTLACKQFVA